MCVLLPLPNRKVWSLLCKCPEKDFYAHVNREAFTKIISNLLNNGVKYAESYVRISLEVPETDDNNSFCIRTENDGVIIPNEMKEEIFKPFVRFNEKRRRQGDYRNRNRLALSRSLAELHQGTLAMGEGEENNTFCLILPIVQDMTITLTPEPEVEIDRMNEIPVGETEKER